MRLSADGQEVGTRTFSIGIDPRIEGVTQADLQARFDLAVRIRDRVSDANEAVILIRDIEAQIQERLEASDDPSLAEEAQDLREDLNAVEGEIYQVRNRSNQDPLNFPIKLNNKLAALLGVVEGSEDRPTEQSYQVFQYLDGLLEIQLDLLDSVLSGSLGAFNQGLEARGLDPISVERSG